MNPMLRLGPGAALLRALVQSPLVSDQDEAERMLASFVHNAGEMIRGEGDRFGDELGARMLHLAADLIDPEGSETRR